MRTNLLSRRNFLAFSCLFPLAQAVHSGVELKGSVFADVGRNKNIDPYLLYAIALAESAFRIEGSTNVIPWRFTLRTKSTAYYGTSYKKTLTELNRILRSTKSVDVGLMQINVLWHGHRVRHPEDLLDVHINVSVAADILNERLKTNRNNWQQSLAQYHSFNVERGYWYATYVLGIYAQIANDVKGKVLVFHW